LRDLIIWRLGPRRIINEKNVQQNNERYGDESVGYPF